MTLEQLAARLKATVDKATVLVNNRLASMRIRCPDIRKMGVDHRLELFDIAAGMDAIGSHVQKWALDVASSAGPVEKTMAPGQCWQLEEAYSLMHAALPKLTVCVSEVFRGVKKHSNMVSVGVDRDSLRTVLLHLEQIVLRLGRVMIRLIF